MKLITNNRISLIIAAAIAGAILAACQSQTPPAPIARALNRGRFHSWYPRDAELASAYFLATSGSQALATLNPGERIFNHCSSIIEIQIISPK